MGDTTMTGRLVQHWVTVTDAAGRTRLEAQWAPPGAPTHVPNAA